MSGILDSLEEVTAAGIRRTREIFPLTRKTTTNLLLLVVMGVALQGLPSPYGIALFSLGTILLSSDYRVLQTVRLGSVHDWIQPRDPSETAQRRYKQKALIEQGPDRIGIYPQGGEDFRASVSQDADNFSEGLRFFLYVEEDLVQQDDDVDTYHLRVAEVELTRVSGQTGSTSLFFSVVEWADDRDREREQERVECVRANLREGDGSDQPFVKIDKTGPVNEFETEEWKAIADWAQTQPLTRTESK